MDREAVLPSSSPPIFSVVVPAYNRAAFLPKSIESVLNQSDPRWELIIVDDGSTDDTTDVVSRYSDARIHLHRKENEERGAARNYGVRHSRGRYVTFLDSDDYLYPEYLSRARESLDQLGDPAFLHLAYETVHPDGRRIQAYDYLKAHDHHVLVEGNPFSCLGWFVRRDVFHELAFEEDRRIAGSEDWEFAVRLVARHGFEVDQRVSAALVRHDLSSVLHFTPEALRTRKLLAVDFAFQDPVVRSRFAGLESATRAWALSYVSLHLALSGHRRAAWRTWLEAVRKLPALIFSRRSLVILKKTVLG